MYRLALGGVGGPILFCVVVVLAAALRDDYSHVDHFMSELGATGSSRAWLMNYAAFLPGGLGLLALGIALNRVLPRGRLTLAASALLMIFGSGVLAAGFVSCDPGCPQVGGSFENSIHDKIAPISFVSAILASALFGIAFRAHPVWKRFSIYSLATSFAALCFLVGLVSSLESRELTGLWQRLLLAALFSWCVVIGLQAYRTGAADSHAA